MSSSSVAALRQELRVELGVNYTRYMGVMREWFANKNNREDWEFDMPFLTGRSREIHNKIMVTILKLCMSPNFEARYPDTTTVAVPVIPSQTHFQVDPRNGKARDHVITLHAAPPPESPRMDMDVDRSVPSLPVSAPPLQITLSIDEEAGDGEEEEESLEESKVKPLFTLGLRKVRCDELEELPIPSLRKVDRRIPSTFLKELLGITREDSHRLIPNVTHTLNITKELGVESELGNYFRPRLKGGPFLTSEGSVPGNFLLKAWQHGVASVNPEVIKIVSTAAEERVVSLLRELIKQRKSFRMKSKGHVQFGEPHENPYILSRHHIPTPTAAERRPYSTILVEPITLPPDAELQEKSEQLAALRGATSMESPADAGQLSRKIGLMEIFLLAKAKPHLFPNWEERTRLLETSLLHSSGFLQTPSPDSPTGLDDPDDEGELFPEASY